MIPEPHLIAGLAGHAVLATAAILLARHGRALVRDLERMRRRSALLRREGDHRLKNCLALVTSLPTLDGMRLADPKAPTLLDTTAGRLRLVERLHARLQDLEIEEHVEVASLFGELARDLESLTARQSRAWRIELTAPARRLPGPTALRLALIAFELIANALKHADPAPGHERITLSFTAAGSDLRLEIRDFGRGRPATPRPSLGSALVANLVEDLGGCLRSEPAAPGTRWILTMPTAPADPVG